MSCYVVSAKIQVYGEFPSFIYLVQAETPDEAARKFQEKHGHWRLLQLTVTDTATVTDMYPVQTSFLPS